MPSAFSCRVQKPCSSGYTPPEPCSSSTAGTGPSPAGRLRKPTIVCDGRGRLGSTRSASVDGVADAKL